MANKKKSTTRMGKPELVRKFAKKLGISIAQAEVALSAYQEAIFDGLEKYDEVKILDFAVIEKQLVEEMEYTIPDREDKCVKEAHIRVKIKMLPLFKKYEAVKEMLSNG